MLKHIVFPLTPFEVFKLIGLKRSSTPGHYRFLNNIRKTAKYKVKNIPKIGWDFPVSHIYPMVQGPSIKPFCFDCNNNFHIIPYSETETSKPIPFSELQVNEPEIALYFAENKRLLDSQAEKSKTMHQGDEFYALSKIGPYTFAPYIVAARDNSNFCASVIVNTKTPWGEYKKSICVKHTIIISQDVEHNFITEDEAHYINGILNSTIVINYIHNTFKKNGFSLKKSRLYIPKYNPKSKICAKIVAISKEATNNPTYRNMAQTELTKEYLKLCKNK